jgi:FtsH-binding integral membrane protein
MLGQSEAREKFVNAARRAKPEERAGVGAFMGTVYAWMTAGLALSAFVAYQCAQSDELMLAMFNGSALGWVLLLSPFLLIFIHAFRMGKAGLLEGAVWYFLTTGIMGTWLSGVAYQATQDPGFADAVYQALFVTVGMFAGMSITGWITRKDLSGFGNFFLAALWGLIFVGVLNVFVMQSAAVNLVYHTVGVVIFAGLTAYDTQQIKGMYYQNGAKHGIAVWGALTLYLDFVNLFLHLLRLMGYASSND